MSRVSCWRFLQLCLVGSVVFAGIKSGILKEAPPTEAQNIEYQTLLEREQITATGREWVAEFVNQSLHGELQGSLAKSVEAVLARGIENYTRQDYESLEVFRGIDAHLSRYELHHADGSVSFVLTLNQDGQAPVTMFMIADGPENLRVTVYQGGKAELTRTVERRQVDNDLLNRIAADSTFFGRHAVIDH